MKLLITIFCLIPNLAYAYLGPGMGGGILLATFGIIFAVIVGIFGFFWFPLKKAFKAKVPLWIIIFLIFIALAVAAVDNKKKIKNLRIIHNKIVSKNDIPPVFKKHIKKEKFVRNFNTNRNALLVLPRYDGNLLRSVVEIIDLNTFEVLHTYRHDIESMNEMVTNKLEHRRLKKDKNELRFLYNHPLILSDGSLVSNYNKSPLFRIDFCGNLMWINDEERFHHSQMLDSDGNIWVPSTLFPYSKLIETNFGTGAPSFGFDDDSIAKINTSGEILFQKSVAEMLIENKFMRDDYNLVNYHDPIHLNDIEPAFTTTKYWEKGDVFLSIRHLSAIVHYRPSTDKVINYFEGPFSMQHDVDIISDKEIAIFNNNNPATKNQPSFCCAEILIYNFETKTYTKKFNPQMIENKIRTRTEGLADYLKDGSIMVEEQNHGRIIFFDKNGNVEWEYVNKDDKGNVYSISWSRIIENQELVNSIRNKINNTNCSEK